MAIHQNIPSMLQESLPEMLLVAKCSIEFRKDTNIWPAPGYFGYPSALLLLSIADSIGSYVEKGSVENHFKVLNNSTYYGLSLAANEIGTASNSAEKKGSPSEGVAETRSGANQAFFVQKRFELRSAIAIKSDF